MRIALVPTVSAPVLADSHGSVEAWSWLLARELTQIGHQVTTFGCGGASVAGEFVETIPGPYGAPGSYTDWQLCEWVNLCRAVEQANRFDLLHTQAYLWGIPLQRLSSAPLLHTLHIVPDENTLRLWHSAPESHVTAISRHQWSAVPMLRPIAVIPHGVDTGQFTYREEPEDYALYLGRFVSGKGPLQAINTARELGLRLVLAGPENAYFREHVKPLVNGKTVEYAGYVKGVGRDRLLGGARVLLYPIQYPEAFGLVLLEAMLCGTPVAAMRLGAVPEIVDEGVTGCTSESMDKLAAAARTCLGLNRRDVRERALARFSARTMARRYAEVYAQVVRGRK